MNTIPKVSLGRLAAVALTAAVMGTTNTAEAQWTSKWLDAGSLHHIYQEAGAWPDQAGSNGMFWPGAYQYTGNMKAKGLWVAVKNYTDETGTKWPVRIAHVGPKSNRGIGEIFRQEFELISRFDPPEVYVDGVLSFRNPVVVDRVDANLKADRMLYNKVNTLLGITIERRIMQFSQGYHDNYHLTEWTFTNTGNIDEDAEIELNQTLEGVQIGMINRYNINEIGRGVIKGGAGWGQNNMVDAVGDGYEDYGVDFRAQYVWHGRMPSFQRWDNMGVPVLDDADVRIQEGDTLGFLAGAHFIGRAYVHVDGSTSDREDDPSQPQTMGYYDADDPLVLNNDPYDIPKMQLEYEFISSGRAYPHHADVVEPGSSWDPVRFANQSNDPSLGRAGGWGFKEGYGPYTLAPGDSIRIVIVEAVNGLSEEAKREIGMAYRNLWQAGNEDAPIDFDANGDGVIGPGESMSKNMWVMTSRDSLFMTFERAIANYESGYTIPRGPMPPRTFTVRSSTNQIELAWETYAGESPRGWEIYRATGRLNAAYERIAELGPAAREYFDTEVERGIDYYYYLQAIGEVNNDGTGKTPTGVPLKSNRYYAQTYNPAILKRDAGSVMSDVRIVPNPFNLGSAADVRWPDQQDKIGFLDIPGQATIDIYTELGVLVRSIEHTDGSGDAYWNLTTSHNQVVVSGIYFAVITDRETGERIVRPFSIIR